jgi:hypothetical protein
MTAVTGATPADRQSPEASQATGKSGSRLIIGAAIICVLAGAGGAVAWQAGILPFAADDRGSSGVPGTAGDASWTASYSDNFLSDSQTLYLTGTANARDYPSSEGTQVLRSYSQGTSVTGRWVEGRDPAVRWFRLDGGGYIWEGNIGGPDTIYPAGMSGLFVGRGLSDFGGRLSRQGLYGDYGPGSDVCEIYRSVDERISVMFEGNTATSFSTESPLLATQEGIRVGMTPADLRAAYGDKLASETNPYDGTDFFVWKTPERGLRFYVGASGLIETIFSGTSSIRYVEGCM